MASSTKRHDPDELHLLLVGSTGAGKSATGNSILLRNRFTETRQAVSTSTIPSTFSDDPLERGQRITVTDTPDISETWLNCETIEGMNFLAQLSPGPNAVLVIINTRDRISVEIENKIKLLCKFLGESATRQMIIVFTSIDSLAKSSHSQDLIPLEEYVGDVRGKSPFMKSLLEKCSMRYMGFNNSIDFNASLEKRQEAKVQLGSLLMMIRDMMEKNNYQRYDIPMVAKIENVMLMLDNKTGSREQSRRKLPEVLGLKMTSGEVVSTISLVYPAATFLGIFSTSFGLSRFIFCLLCFQLGYHNVCRAKPLSVFIEMGVVIFGGAVLFGAIKMYQRKINRAVVLKDVMKPAIYGGLFGLLEAYYIGFNNPAMILSGGYGVALIGLRTVLQWKNTAYTKMVKVIEMYQKSKC